MRLKSCVIPSCVVAWLVSLAGDAACQSYEEEVMKLDPIAYWRMDDAEGDIDVENLGFGDAFAEYHEESMQQVPGLIDDPNSTAVRFLGGDDVADGEDLSGVHVPDFAELNTGGPYAAKSIVLWFQADDVSPFDEQVLFEEGGSTRGINLYISEERAYVGAWNRADDDGGLTSPWESGDEDPPGGNVYLSEKIENDTIYQLALVMNGDTEGIDGTLTGYLNGTAFAEVGGVGQMFNHGDDAGIGHVHQNTYFQSGNWNQGHGRHFAGVIDEVALFNEALTAEQIATLYETGVGGVRCDVRGDFNCDNVLDAADINMLSEQVRAGTNPGEFDLTGDGLVNQDDRAEWVQAEDIKHTWFGDANLDGEFGSGDLVVVFSGGKFETNEPAGWEQGDWNGDGTFGSGDLVSAFSDGGFEMGPRGQANAVPEPATGVLLLLGLISLARRRRCS